MQKEEAELERLREKERIRSGKELLEAKRKEDDLKLKRNLELRRIEKEEEARARDKIRVKLGAYPHALLMIPFSLILCIMVTQQVPWTSNSSCVAAVGNIQFNVVHALMSCCLIVMLLPCNHTDGLACSDGLCGDQ